MLKGCAWRARPDPQQAVSQAGVSGLQASVSEPLDTMLTFREFDDSFTMIASKVSLSRVQVDVSSCAQEGMLPHGQAPKEAVCLATRAPWPRWLLRVTTEPCAVQCLPCGTHAYPAPS